MCKQGMLIRIAMALCIALVGIGQVGFAQSPTDVDDGRGTLDPALVGWWQLNETSGDVAFDSGPNGYHGRLRNGPKWVTGIEGNGLRFDGTDDYVAITRAYYGRAGHEDVTIALWIRTDSENDQVLVSFDRNEYWRLEINGPVAEDGQIGWGIMTDAGQLELASRTAVDDGRWHHVAGVFDRGRATIYIDGSPDATVVLGRTFGTGTVRFGFLGVGSEADSFDGMKGPENYFAGTMDDVRFFTRALSREEIEALAFSGPGNDQCSNAAPVGEVEDLPFDTREATHDGKSIVIRSPNLWFLYTPSCTGTATISLAGSQYDTMLAVYSGAACDPGQDRLLAFNDDFVGLTSQVSFEVVTGEKYLVEVGGFDQRTGQGVMTISCEGVIQAEHDLGDAPDSSNHYSKRMTAYADGYGVIEAHFPTVFESPAGRPVGPLHLDPLAVAHLGEAVSFEMEADKGPDEDGVNNINPPDDEANKDGADDGVILPLVLPHGELAYFEYIVSVIAPDQDLWVNVWFDWNRDGDWDDDSESNPEMVADERYVSEWAVRNQYLFSLPIGTHKIATPGFLPWHPVKGPEEVWMRITLSEKPWKGGDAPGTPGNGGSGPADGYETGETEDYLIASETGCSLCKDYNEDGKIDFDDLIALMYEWLDCCSQ